MATHCVVQVAIHKGDRDQPALEKPFYSNKNKKLPFIKEKMQEIIILSFKVLRPTTKLRQQKILRQCTVLRLVSISVKLDI
jgi:hypothetical protein